MSCTHKGEDMSLEIFRKALENNSDDYFSIGGGEPTLHPFFWQILMECVAVNESVWLATNGSNTQISLALERMARNGVIGCALSLDPFHDPIDSVVVNAFRKTYTHADDDRREIRDTSKSLIKAGRCKNGKKGCICPDLFIKPNGDVMGCGCDKAKKYGNVTTGYKVPKNYTWGGCSLKKD
jgi:hypothetical protein